MISCAFYFTRPVLGYLAFFHPFAARGSSKLKHQNSSTVGPFLSLSGAAEGRGLCSQHTTFWFPQYPSHFENPYRDGWRDSRDTRHSLYYIMTGYDRQANGGWTERRRSQSQTGNGVGGEKGWWQDSKQAHWGDEKGWRDGSSTAKGALPVMPAPATMRFILLCCLWYTSSALSSNTGKSIMLIFKFPITLTFVQFGFIAGYCLLLASPVVGLTRIRGPSAAVLHSTIPMAAFQVGGHIFSSFAISRIPVSTVHTIKVCNISDLFL